MNDMLDEKARGKALGSLGVKQEPSLSALNDDERPGRISRCSMLAISFSYHLLALIFPLSLPFLYPSFLHTISFFLYLFPLLQISQLLCLFPLQKVLGLGNRMRNAL